MIRVLVGLVSGETSLPSSLADGHLLAVSSHGLFSLRLLLVSSCLRVNDLGVKWGAMRRE